jgi:methionine-rich copper-binding protein CopC
MKIATYARLSFLLLVAGSAIAAAPRSAMHTHLKKSLPAANDTVPSPASLELWFSEKIELPFSRVTIKNLAGVAQPLGTLKFSDGSDTAAVVVPVTASLAPGEYTVGWSAAAQDGHPAKGTFKFTVKAGN